MDKRIAEWLASGDTGSSSKAIMLWLSSGTTDKKWGPDTPRDAGDLARCLRLLEIIPEWHDRMPEMASAGGLWPTFMTYWNEIVATFLEECGGTIPSKFGEWPSTERTYALIRRANDLAYKTDRPSFEEVRFDSGKLSGCSVRFDKGSPLGAALAAVAKAKTK